MDVALCPWMGFTSTKEEKMGNNGHDNSIGILGKRFGNLTVVAKTELRKDRQVIWECLCDCGNKTNVRSRCLRTGSSTSCGCRMSFKTPDTDRFLSHFSQTEGGCWEWQGSIGKNKYGVISIGGKMIYAHRFSYEYFKDPIPTGMYICHTCDNPRCVNPEHLWVGTAKDNISDCVSKRRNSTILTETDVLQIRELRKLKGLSLTELSALFNTHKTNVFKIIKRESWKHV